MVGKDITVLFCAADECSFVTKVVVDFTDSEVKNIFCPQCICMRSTYRALKPAKVAGA